MGSAVICTGAVFLVLFVTFALAVAYDREEIVRRMFWPMLGEMVLVIVELIVWKAVFHGQ